jgi:hypothetical protein
MHACRLPHCRLDVGVQQLRNRDGSVGVDDEQIAHRGDLLGCASAVVETSRD